MSILSIQNLYFSYSSASQILNSVNLQLTNSWYGLVGENGSGKTTFLKLLLDEIQPETGTIKFSESDTVVNFCPQRIEYLTETITTFSQKWDKVSIRIKDRLCLVDSDVERWPTLSPGERKKWQIGAALAEMPDILLLDEPTNHLDSEGASLLLSVLQQFKGIGILVSHNRHFLDTLTRFTLWLEKGKIRLFDHSYSETKNLVFEEKTVAYEKRDTLRNEQKKVEKQLQSISKRQHGADNSISCKSRMKGIRDHDGRSMSAKGRAIKAEKKIGQDVTKTRSDLNRISEDLKDHFVEKELGRSLFLNYEKAKKNPLISLKMDKLSIGEKVLLDKPELTINRDSKIHLAGANGSGKSTLVSTIRKNLQLPVERLLYLPQELTEEDEVKLLTRLLQLPNEERGKVFQYLAALGLSYDKLSLTERPSPGEARKLLIAEGLSRQAWLLILDEPTNHLDLPSIERLENALAAFPGAILLITHDDQLANRCTDEVLKISQNRIISS